VFFVDLVNLVSGLLSRVDQQVDVGADDKVGMLQGHMYKFQRQVVQIYSYGLGANMGEVVREVQEKDVAVTEEFSTFDCDPMLDTSS
jgi:hypothetical protein